MLQQDKRTRSWETNRDILCNRISTWGQGTDLLIASASGNVVLSHFRSDAFEGTGHDMPYATIGMCTAGGGEAQRTSDYGELVDVWRPGRVGFVLPSSAVQGRSPAMEMLMVAFTLDDIPACHGDSIDLESLKAAANKLHDDPLISSVLIAMKNDAEAHGAATAFFDHGLSLILQRLVECTTTGYQPQTVTGLSRSLAPLLDEIEARLDEDLRVTDFTQTLGLSPRTVTRLFKRELGQTPYQYITSRRMKRAKYLLGQGISVTDTALSIGFSNPAKFAAAFRRWAGASPSEWQRIHSR